MIQANVHDAKTRLSQLISRAEAGEEVVIARNGKPAVRLTPVGGRRILDSRPRTDVWLPNEEELALLKAEVAQLFEDSANAPLDGFEVSVQTQALYDQLVEPT